MKKKQYPEIPIHRFKQNELLQFTMSFPVPSNVNQWNYMGKITDTNQPDVKISNIPLEWWPLSPYMGMHPMKSCNFTRFYGMHDLIR